jgi:hypothetical protein
MLECTGAITNEVLEPIMFVLAYPTMYVQGGMDNGTATAIGWVLNPSRNKRLHLLQSHSDWFWGSPSFPFNAHQVSS